MTYNNNISNLLQDTEVFGLGLVGDGASIKWMPFLNVLVLCGNAPPTVASIVVCTSHISDGGRRMQHILWINFEGKWMRLMLTESLVIVSFLMVHQMSNLMVLSCAQLTLAQSVSMEGNMSCHCFSATSTKSNPYS